MCSTPDIPEPKPVPEPLPPPKAPEPTATVEAAPVGVKARQRRGATRGTAALRIPLKQATGGK